MPFPAQAFSIQVIACVEKVEQLLRFLGGEG